MKKLIVALMAVTAFNFSAHAEETTAKDVIALIQKMESQMIAKDNQIEHLRAKLAEAEASPDLERALKLRFEKALGEAKTSVNKITEDVLSKLKEIKK
jgi:hypothetical protein